MCSLPPAWPSHTQQSIGVIYQQKLGLFQQHSNFQYFQLGLNSHIRSRFRGSASSMVNKSLKLAMKFRGLENIYIDYEILIWSTWWPLFAPDHGLCTLPTIVLSYAHGTLWCNLLLKAWPWVQRHLNYIPSLGAILKMFRRWIRHNELVGWLVMSHGWYQLSNPLLLLVSGLASDELYMLIL
jgi:hypothetical protein